MTDDTDFDMGELRLRVGKLPSEQTTYTLWIDRIALARDGTLYLLSVVGPPGAIKGLRAALDSKNKIPAVFEVNKLHVSNAQDKGGFAHKFHTEENQKFSIKVQPLGFGQSHALFLSMTPGFLKVVDPESLYQELMQPHHTTPMLRSWVPWVASDLEKKGVLSSLFCFRCQCSILTATDDDLDATVTAGIQGGFLKFREFQIHDEGEAA